MKKKRKENETPKEGTPSGSDRTPTFSRRKKVSHTTPFPRILGVFRPGVLTGNSRVLHFYGRLRDS